MEAGRLTRLEEGIDQDGISAESGFSLLELMTVISVMLIMASIAAPIYSRILTRSHEAVLRDDLFTMRSLIDRYTLDNQRPPESLDELVQAGYLKGGLPVDPFTGSNQTWQPEMEDVSSVLGDSVPGVIDVHSGSDATSLEGTPYSSW
jgi:general secretion pathway protein G